MGECLRGGAPITIGDPGPGERALRLLVEAGAVLLSSLDYEKTLSTVADLCVRELADFCAIDIVEQDGEIRRLQVVARDPADAWIAALLHGMELDRRRPYLAGAALQGGHAVLIPEVTPAMLERNAQSEEHLAALRLLGPRSAMAVPLIAHGTLLGALVLVTRSGNRTYDHEDLRLAEQLGARAAHAVANARRYREAQRAIKARDEVLGVVAHDLLNPLTSVQMQSALLRRQDDKPERRSQEPAEIIRRSVMRMKRLIQDLLDVTRMEAGAIVLDRGPVSPARVLADAVAVQRHLARSSSLTLSLSVDASLPDVWADRDRLLQVLENLVGNAIKFTPAGGTISVGASPHGDGVRFFVRDTGEGIAAGHLPHVFERFWQAEGNDKRGAGLGLAIVKGIVDAHGGEVTVESERGVGSEFAFTLPLAARATVRESREVSRASMA